MYIFYRSARLGPGNLRDQLAWTVQITEKVNQICETPFELWVSTLSPGVGTFVWTTSVEELSELEANEAKLLADDGYHSLVERGAAFSSGAPIDDGLLQVIHATATDRRAEYTAVVDSVVAPGNFVRGMTVGVEIAQLAERITGIPTMFAASTTGAYGGVSWLTGYEDIAQMQRAQEAMAADPSFAGYLDSDARDVFQAGSLTAAAVYRRMI